MRQAFTVAAALLLVGCAIAKQTYTAEGKPGHTINCSGPMMNWGMCYEKAGKLCGERGYDVLHKDTDHVASAGGGSGYFGASSSATRTLVIACRE